MKIAFITGLSDYNNTNLSQLQINLLSKLELDNEDKIFLNFPYIKSSKTIRDINIICASISNTIQYFLFRTSWLNKREVLFKELLSKEDKFVLLSGSCGLEIIRNLKLTEEEKNKLFIISYGSVAKEIPNYNNLILIQGDSDWISKFFIKKYDFKINANHMNYLYSEEFVNLIKLQLNKWLK